MIDPEMLTNEQREATSKDLYHRKRRINVTPSILERACRKDSSHCMIAEAIKEAWPDVYDVSVDVRTIRMTDRKAGKRFVYLTPQNCVENLIKFDFGVKLDPWHFFVPMRPAQVYPLTVRDQSKANKAKRPKNTGKKEIKASHDSPTPLVHGGRPPMTAALASSARGGPRGRKRIFGMQVLASFDPTR